MRLFGRKPGHQARGHAVGRPVLTLIGRDFAIPGEAPIPEFGDHVMLTVICRVTSVQLAEHAETTTLARESVTCRALQLCLVQQLDPSQYSDTTLAPTVTAPLDLQAVTDVR